MANLENFKPKNVWNKAKEVAPRATLSAFTAAVGGNAVLNSIDTAAASMQNPIVRDVNTLNLPNINRYIAPVSAEIANPACGVAIAVPKDLAKIPAVLPENAPFGQYFLPVFDASQANKEHNYRGIGPWWPVAGQSIDDNAGHLDGNIGVGNLHITSDNGGLYAFSVMQEANHHNEGLYNPDQVSNKDWDMQYTFSGMEAGADILICDPDTGMQYTWDDGSPVVYKSNRFGTASFELPKADGKDVRVQFVFNLPGQNPGEQKPQIKVQRGPNDHPELKGENPLPSGVIKDPVVETTR